jgi:hypothetical protein
VIERLADARRDTRQTVWDTGGAPPVITAANAAWDAGDRESVFRLYGDIDATLITCWCDDRDGLRQAGKTYKKAGAPTRWCSTWTAAMARASRWPACNAPETPGATPQLTTWRCSTWAWRRCPNAAQRHTDRAH